MNSLFAYFDPGSGSILMQALVGGTAGLFVFGKYLWNSAFSKSSLSLQKHRRSELKPRSGNSSGEIPITAV